MANSEFTGDLRQTGSRIRLTILKGRTRWWKDYPDINAAAAETNLIGLPKATEVAARAVGPFGSSIVHYPFAVPVRFNTDVLVQHDFKVVRVH